MTISRVAERPDGALSEKVSVLRPDNARSKNALSAGFGRAVAVQPFAHFLARLEKRDALLIDRHMCAGTRIAPRAGGGA